MVLNGIRRTDGNFELFRFTTAINLILALYTVFRLRSRAPSGKPGRKRWAALLRTSPVFARMATAGGGADEAGHRSSRDKTKTEGDKAAQKR